MVDLIYVGLTNEECNMHRKSGDASFSIWNNTHSKNDRQPWSNSTPDVNKYDAKLRKDLLVDILSNTGSEEGTTCWYLEELGQYQAVLIGTWLYWADMEFVQNFTPPDFQAKNFTPSISPNFNSFSKKKHKK